jgi:hypothetical protein
MPQSHVVTWLRDGGAIAGASGTRYDPVGADAGHQLRCSVTAANLAGSATATSDPVDVSTAVAPPRAGPVVVSGLKVVPSSFQAAKHGGPIVPGGYAAVSYRLSSPAKVTFSVERPVVGRRRGRSCVRPTPKLRKSKKKCKRYVAVPGSFQRPAGAAGPDRFHFSGRLGGRALKPGAYRLVAVADAGGPRSQPAMAGFHIRAPRHRRGRG